MMMGSLKRPGIIRILACLLLVNALLISLVSAAVDSYTIPPSKDLLEKDNPEIISALKTHIAWVGQTQQARMDGVIVYINSISGGNGTSGLEDTKNDYLDMATSIPVMQTADDIVEARGELRTQSQLFSEETKAQMVMFNGNFSDMRRSIDTSEKAVEITHINLKDPLWLANESARLVMFNRESTQRSVLIAGLKKRGVDVSLAQNLSDQIDAQRPALQKALLENSVGSLKKVNTGIRTLNRQFRGMVSEFRYDLEIQQKHEAILSMSE